MKTLEIWLLGGFMSETILVPDDITLESYQRRHQEFLDNLRSNWRLLDKNNDEIAREDIRREHDHL